MPTILQRASRDPFVRNSAVFFSGSMIVAFLNYCFHPVLSRLMTVRDFGEVQALLALFTELTMALGAFTYATIHASTNCERPEECAAVIKVLNVGAFIVVGVLFLMIAIGARSFASAFQFHSIYPFFVLAALLVTSVFYSIRIGYLQGQQKFGKVTVANVMVAAGRLAFAAVFVWLGWKSSGAIGGVVAAQVLALGFVYWHTRHALNTDRHEIVEFPRARVYKELGYVILAFCAMAFVTLLYTADVLAVKRYFSPDIAGFYSGISAIGKIVVFASSPFAAVMLSSIKRANPPSVNRRALQKGLIGAAAVGGGALILFAAIPELIIRVLMGARYTVFAHYLPPISLAFYFVVLTNVFVMFGLALRKQGLMFLAFVGCLLLIILIVARHASVDQVIQDFIIASAAALAGSVALVWKRLWEKDAPPLAPVAA